MSRRGGGHGAGPLSMLARGHGLLGGGVQVECFADDRRAFTLMGQPILKPSSTSPGTTKPYRSHQLALPATYVTRRGQMVLFTAPEDMIIGSSCHIHKKEREMTSELAAKKLKTTNNLLNSALSYGVADKKSPTTSPLHDNEDVSMATTGVKAGHFTNVYLNSLQKATLEKKSTNQIADDCAVEDIETATDTSLQKDSTATDSLMPADSEVPLNSESDSGCGQSISTSPSGRISVQSHISSDASSMSFMSSGHVIRVPDGRDDNQMVSEGRGSLLLTTPTEPRLPVGVTDGDPLSSLRKELGLEHIQVSYSKSDKKSSTKTGKKRHHTKDGSSCHESRSSSKAGERKAKKQNSIVSGDGAGRSGSKSSKSRRKRKNKSDTNKGSGQNGNQDSNMEISTDDIGVSETADGSEERLKVTAVQLGASVAGESGGVEGSRQKTSAAEERRREIERKRAEKRELERKKREEEERKLKLQEEIENLSSTDLQTDLPSSSSTNDRDVLAAHSVMTVGQKSLRADLEEMRLKHARLLLSYQGEGVEDGLTEDMESARAAIERARAAKEREEERRRLLGGEKGEGECEKCGHEGRTESQQPEADTLTAGTTSTVYRRSQNTLNAELPTERRLESFTGKYMFSYFKYVPQQKAKTDNKKGKRSKRPKGKKSK